MKIALRTYI